jgi:CheY-like chemotaxis protein
MTRSIPCRVESAVSRSRILVIDDNASLGRSFARILSAYDCVVESDPVKALARIEAGEAFALVLCDLHMPKMTGWQVLRAIREHFAERAGMPQLVVMSGSNETDGNEPEVPLLLKPCDKLEIRATVARLLEST